ncbi:MAG: hypothetical protein WDN28_09715 [Chthoniobacter sp.]
MINFENLGGDLQGALCYLPSYTATAHFHGKLPPDLQADRAKAIAESRAFAQGDYALALLKGAALPRRATHPHRRKTRAAHRPRQ